MLVATASIPSELQERPQWVVWRYEMREGKPTKIPYQAADPRREAKSTDPATWGTFEQATAAAVQADGIGFVFSPDDPYAGIDFDEITPDVEDAIRTLDSYTEKSVSGRGAHVIIKGALPDGKGRRRGKFEVYCQGRYFAMTGVPLNGRLQRIASRQDALSIVMDRFIPPKPVEERPRAPLSPVTLSDQDLLDKMFASASGAKIRRLWDGDCSDYPSHSEADAALCCHLAFWTGNDAARVDSLFRHSGLMRDKWDRGDYRVATIGGAIDKTKEVYTQPRPVSIMRPLNGRHAQVEEGEVEPQDGANDSPFVDWRTFWAREREPAEWVFEDVLARGRGHAIYAKHKQGKSLLTLYMAAKIATGEQDVVVVYLDYEMGEEDLYERLDGMGYGARDDLSRLRYALLPLLPPLDTDAGCAALSAMLDGVQAEYPDMHQVVIIDTIGRAVKGPEDEADTWRDFHRHAGMMLKRRGCTWARLDHGGKDIAKGQRGSSGKGDDPDVVWRLERTQNGVTLHRDVARMAWVPEKVTFKIVEPPLSFEPAPFDWPAGTWETIEVLNRLGVPLSASVKVANAALRDADEGRRTAIVSAALRARREQREATE